MITQMNYSRLTITLCILFTSLLFMKKTFSQDCERETIVGEAFLDENNISALYHPDGRLYSYTQDQQGNVSLNFEAPKGSGIHSIFAGGIWMGGLDGSGDLHVAAETYRQGIQKDFYAGPLNADGTTNTDLEEAFTNVWSVEQGAIEAFLLDAADGTLNNPIPDDILKWPGKDNPQFPESAGRELAPFVDANSDGRYNPYDFDYPKIKGSKMLWWVFNDALETHTQSNGESLGFEIQASAYAYSCIELEHMNNSVFLELDIINKSSNDYNEVYIGKWLDPDLGNFSDDYVGCHVDLNTLYTYNGDNLDEGCANCIPSYENDIPVQAITFLNQELSAYLQYNNQLTGPSANPQSPEEYYNFLKAIWRDGSHLTYGGNGINGSVETDFMFDGNPNSPGEWSKYDVYGEPTVIEGSNNTAVGSIGPFNLNQGEMIEVDMLVSWHLSSSGNHLESVTTMLGEIPLLQTIYNNNFMNLPCIPTPECRGAICIWPGEIDNSSKANAKDMLEIGIAYGSTGDERENPSSYWLPQQTNDWTGTFLTGFNYKHADTDGNGLVDECDVLPINLNYDYQPLLPRNPVVGGVPVTIEFGQTEVGPGEVLDVYVYYGEESDPVQGAYGAAFFVEYNSELVKQEETTVDMETTTWLDDDGVMLISMYEDIPSQSRIDVAVSRTNQTGIDGWGQVGHLRFTMRDDIAGEFLSALDFNITVVDGRAINFAEVEEQLNLGGGSVPVVTGIEDLTEAQISMYPNPVRDVLFINSLEKEISNIKIIEMSGRTVMELTPKNQRSIEIQTANLAKGIYFIELLVEGEWIRNRVLVD